MSASSIQSNPVDERTLQEVAKMVRGEVEGRAIFIHNEKGDRIRLPISPEIFPTAQSLKDRVSLFHEEPNRAYKVSTGTTAATIAVCGAHFVVQATSGLAPLVNGLFAARVVGYPLSAGVNGYASSEQLKMLEQVQDVEGIQIQRNKIKESVLSFLGGVFYTGSEAAVALGASSLAAILSATMLPLYALGFAVSYKTQTKQISLSKQLKKDLVKHLSLPASDHKGWEKWLEKFIGPTISSEDLSKKDLRKGLNYLKELITPEEQALEDVAEELKKENPDKILIKEKLDGYKNEQFKKFQVLERKIGSDAAQNLIDNLDKALTELESGDLESAQKLLESVEMGASSEIIKAAIAILAGLIILAMFVAMTIITHGATLSLLL